MSISRNDDHLMKDLDGRRSHIDAIIFLSGCGPQGSLPPMTYFISNV
jgi:hypothetical protein